MKNQILLAITIVGLQAICFIIAFLIYSAKQKINKKRMLDHKREIIKGMLYDKDIEIESSWILNNDAQKELERVKQKIKNNFDLIESEESKDRNDRNQAMIKKLRDENKRLALENEKLIEEIADYEEKLKRVGKDPYLYEKIAREELGIAKEGEIVIDIKE